MSDDNSRFIERYTHNIHTYICIHDITLALITIRGESGGAHAIEYRGRRNLDCNVIRIRAGYAYSGGIPGSVSRSVRPVRASYHEDKRKRENFEKLGKRKRNVKIIKM